MPFHKEHADHLQRIQDDIEYLRMKEKCFKAAQSKDMTPLALLTEERAKREKEAVELAKAYAMAKALGATVNITDAQPDHPFSFTVEDYHGQIEISYTENGVTLDADILHHVWDKGETYAQRKSHAVFRLSTDAWNTLRDDSKRCNALQKQEDKAMSFGDFTFARYKRALTSFIIAMSV